MALINLLRFISLKHIRFQKTQTILSVLGICIGVSAIVSMGIVNENILVSFENTINYSMGRASLQISGSASGFPEDIVDRVREVPGVEHAVPAIEASGTLYGTQERTIMILGVDSLQDQHIREYRLSGDNAEIPDPLLFLAKADSILLARELADREKIKIDQQIRVETIEGIHSFKVRGLLSPEGPAKAMAGNMAVMDIFAAQKAFGQEGRIDRIDVSLQSGADLETVRKGILTALPQGYSVETSAGRTKQVENMISRFRNGLGLMRFVIIFVGMYIIYNSVSVTVLRRKREIGILRALGTTKSHIAGLFIAEAVLNGMIGSLAGAALGVFQAKASIGTIARLVSELYLNTSLAELNISWTHLAVGLGSGLTASLMAALFPALGSSRISPISAIRSTPYKEDGFFNKGRLAVLSVMLIGLAVILVTLYKLFPSTPYFHSMMTIFLASTSVLLGLSLASPCILKLFLSFFHKNISPVLGPEGRLAGLNLQKNIFRNAVAAAAVFFGIAMFVNGVAVTSSTERGAMDYMDAIVKADIIVTAGRPLATMGSHNTPMPFAVMDEIDTIPGVSSTDPYRMMYVDYRNTRVLVMSLDMRQRLAYTDFVIYQGSKQDILRLLPSRDNIVVNEGFAVKNGIDIGDRVTLPTPGGSVSFGVAAVVQEYSSDSGSIFMDTRTFQQHWGDRLLDVINVRTTSKEAIPGVIEAIQKKVGSNRKLFALPLQEWRKQLKQLIEDNFVFNHAISVLTLTIACFGIIVTLFSSVIERTREIAILRSLGMFRKQVFRVVVIESMLLGFVGGMLGCLGGAFIGWLSLEGFFRADFGPSTAYCLPYSALVLALLISVIVAALSGIYPAWRAARTNIVEALAYE
jgi:putative ABC transport system permease protein